MCVSSACHSLGGSGNSAARSATSNLPPTGSPLCGNVQPQLSQSWARDDCKGLGEGKGSVCGLAGQGEGAGRRPQPWSWGPGIQDLKPQVLPALLLHQLPGTSAQCAQVQVEGTKSPTDRNCLSTGSAPGCGDPEKNQKQQQRSGTCPATPSPDQTEPRGNPDKRGCFPGRAAS